MKIMSMDVVSGEETPIPQGNVMMKELPALAVHVGSLRDAWRWQEARGGHVFAGADGVTFAWFNLSHTISAVMLHPMLRGVSGTVNPKRGVA